MTVGDRARVLGPLPAPLGTRAGPEEVVRRLYGLLGRKGFELPVRLWDGTELGPSDRGYRLFLPHPWSLRAMFLTAGDRPAGEAYVHGDIDVEGSMVEALHDGVRLARHLDLSLGEQARLARWLLSLPLPPERRVSRRARIRGAVHSKERNEQAVRFHYDVGNDFYALVLDERRVYSCAYFSDEDPSDPAEDPKALDRAQVRKLDMVCRKLRLREGERFLDIGCGWGSLVVHAAEHYGVHALGITLSEPQAELARSRVREAGLSGRVEIRVADYREIAGRFDAVASVGMFEHVGETQFDVYFARAAELTAPAGRFLNHAITTGRRNEVYSPDPNSFVGAYVFPDGAIAPAHVAVRLMEEAGFELIDVHQLRPHYARTLRHWLHNLEGQAEEARAEAGKEVYRTWRAYMSGSVVSFETGNLGVVQVLGAKPGAQLPLGRKWMEPPPALDLDVVQT